MALTRIIGDIHGKFNPYLYTPLGIGRNLKKNESPPERSVQVGDFGIGFANNHWHKLVNDWMIANPNHRFIRGNHDDPSKCKEMSGYIEDGTVENDVMYIGGAWSIDHAYRLEGKDWWRDEELSIEELNRLIDVYSNVKPRVMITHDCPTAVAWEMFISKGHSLAGINQIKTRTGEALQAMFEIHKPQEWYFGHWHHTSRMNILGTEFTCLDELHYVDVDL